MYYSSDDISKHISRIMKWEYTVERMGRREKHTEFCRVNLSAYYPENLGVDGRTPIFLIIIKMNYVVLRRPLTCSEFCSSVFYGILLPSFLTVLSIAFSNTLIIGQRVISEIKISSRRMWGIHYRRAPCDSGKALIDCTKRRYTLYNTCSHNSNKQWYM